MNTTSNLVMVFWFCLSFFLLYLALLIARMAYGYHDGHPFNLILIRTSKKNVLI